MLLKSFLGFPFAVGFIMLLIIIILIPFVFYLITLQNTLKAISPHNRKIPPSNVWLLFIPFFNYIYNFIVVGSIADSIRAEAYEKNIIINEQRPGSAVGTAMCVLQLCSFIPLLGVLSSIAALICWIIYWVKIAGYKTQIERAIPLFDFEREQQQENSSDNM